MSQQGDKAVRPSYWMQACHELQTRDARMAALIAAYDGELLSSHGDAFVTLARAIVGQQVSVLAADRLWARLTAALGAVTPQAIVGAEVAVLRAAGLSQRKVEYLRDLAAHFVSGGIDPRGWAQKTDEAIIAELTAVRGIGRWTAQMFLIFHLLRPDVWPYDDLGLRRALVQHYGLPEEAAPRFWLEAGERWRPWRTVATWYLWRSLDPVPVAY